MAKIPKIVFGNKEKKQFPDPEGLEREKPSSAIEGSTQPIGFETSRKGSKFSEAAPPLPGARETLNNRLKRVGAVRRGISLVAPRKEEVDSNMENKSFNQFVTEAKRGRPRKLRPGEQADTEHLQDQLSKLTHPNHVVVHFKDGSKHTIPRGHANKALQHLAGLKPEHRAARVEFMHHSHENFYKGLAGHPTPSKKKSITLAGPKLRKEETEADWKKDSEAVKNSKDKKFVSKMIDKWGHRGGAWLNHPALKKEEVELEEAKLSYDEFTKGRVTKDSDTQTLKDMIKKNNKNRGGGSRIMNRKYKEELAKRASVKEETELDEAKEADRSRATSKKYAKQAVTGMDEEFEQIDEISREAGNDYYAKATVRRDSLASKANLGKATPKELKRLSARNKGIDTFAKKAGYGPERAKVHFGEAKDNDKPERSEHSWPTRRNKQGGWHWANSLTGGHASAEAADRHYVNSMKKMSNTKVHIDDIKPGDRPLSKPVGLGGRSRGLPKWAKNPVKEEAEQIDEISAAKKADYVDKAKADHYKKWTTPLKDEHKTPTGKVKKSWKNSPERKEAGRKLDQRRKYINKAEASLKKEEVEQIDELKASTMSSYADKREKELRSKPIIRGSKEHKQWQNVVKTRDKVAAKLHRGGHMTPSMAREEVETDEKKKLAHHKALQKFRHRIDEIKAIKGHHATKQHAAKVINPGKVGYAGKQTLPKVQDLRREDYAPSEDGQKQNHPDEKVVAAKTRKQGAEKPLPPKKQFTPEELELYNTLSEPHKIIFEKMEKAKRDDLIDKYFKKGGKVTQGKYNQPRESEKPWPASKKPGSKWSETARGVKLKNQGFKK